MDTIVYTLVSKGGGIDGRDHTDKGGDVTKAYLTRQEAEKDPNLPWNTIKPEVVDLDELGKTTLRKLGPVERLAVFCALDALPKKQVTR
jgi:hypothetical protein